MSGENFNIEKSELISEYNTVEYASKERNDQLKRFMKTFSSGNPKVGIFWYLPDEHDLFEVHSVNLKSLDLNKRSKYGITLDELHQDIWSTKKKKAIWKEDYDSIFMKDYTQIPRGRIFYNPDTDQFDVYVGSWYRKYEKELTKLIKLEFNLDKFNYVVSEHWELGHGWSE